MSSDEDTPFSSFFLVALAASSFMQKEREALSVPLAKEDVKIISRPKVMAYTLPVRDLH